MEELTTKKSELRDNTPAGLGTSQNSMSAKAKTEIIKREKIGINQRVNQENKSKIFELTCKDTLESRCDINSNAKSSNLSQARKKAGNTAEPEDKADKQRVQKEGSKRNESKRRQESTLQAKSEMIILIRYDMKDDTEDHMI